MARTADALAKATGMGGALFGVLFVALATDLPEITLTPTAVLSGSPRLAIGNLLGSAAAQLVLLAVVDVVFRQGQLLARAPLLSSLGPGALMLAVLAVPLVVAAANPTVSWIGLGTVLMVVAYVGTLGAVRGVEDPKAEGSPGPEDRERFHEAESVPALWGRFALLAAVLAGAGIALETSTETIGAWIGLGETAAGALLAGVATSLPELVTAVAAVRINALGLVVGDLIGSSALDIALLALADATYTSGSVFDLIAGPELTLLGVCLALTSLLVLGLARRSPGPRTSVGIESYLMIVVYLLGVVILLAG